MATLLPAEAGARQELRLRIISALVMAAAALATAYFGGLAFALLWAALAAIICVEWIGIARPSRGGGLGWAVGGFAYAQALLISVVALRMSEQLGLEAILFLFAVVWSADIGAYFAGRTFGGPRLAPAISPKKTWSGLVGGLFVAIAAGLSVLSLAGLSAGWRQALVAAALALASVAGDLFESHFKRRFGVKDSGRIIPGHGGVMDRLDGFLVAAVLAALIGALRAGPMRSAEGLLLW